MEIDPANPKWWERFSKLPHWRRLRSLGRGPLGNGRLRPLSHPLGELAQLAPAATAGDVSWEAYLLPIKRPGQPHVLEVDYPSDVPQTMGISIIEPNAAGAVLPIGLDSGVDQAEEVVAAAGTPRMAPPPPGLLAADQDAAGADHQPPRPPAGRLRQDPRAGGSGSDCRRPFPAGRAAAASGCWPPTSIGRCLPRTSRPRQTLGALSGLRPRRLGHLLRRRHAAGRLL